MSLRVHDANDTMIGWKAWYGDGKSFCSAKYRWELIPVENFQYLKVFYDRCTDSFAGQDLYCITGHSTEIKRLIDEDPRNIKIGKAISKLEWNMLERRVENDKEKVTRMI